MFSQYTLFSIISVSKNLTKNLGWRSQLSLLLSLPFIFILDKIVLFSEYSSSYHYHYGATVLDSTFFTGTIECCPALAIYFWNTTKMISRELIFWFKKFQPTPNDRWNPLLWSLTKLCLVAERGDTLSTDWVNRITKLRNSCRIFWPYTTAVA